MTFSWEFFFRYLLEPSGIYLQGLWLTLSLSVVAQAFGTVIGLAAALARLATFWPLRLVADAYVWVIRGTPLLVQIVFIYTGLAAAGIFHFQDLGIGMFVLPGNVQAGLVALSLNEGAYMCEIIRAGIGAIDSGQTEAAKSLGMTPALTMRRIVLPQAIRLIIPPLGNDFNAMLKNTTLLSVIGVPELLLATQMVTSATFRVFELYAVVALYYLSLTTLWGVAQQYLERRCGAPYAAVAAPRRSFWRRVFIGWQP